MNKIGMGGTDGKAQTVSNGTNKTIYMNMTDGMDWKEAGLLLGHEAYRDGVVSDVTTQKAETVSAVNGHTEMALKMLGDGLYRDDMKKMISGKQNYKDDIQMYTVANALGNKEIFSNYVENMYDSSADYWKLMEDGTLVNGEDGWLRDKNGNLILNKDGNMIGANNIETGLLNIMYGGTNGKSYDSFTTEEKIISNYILTNSDFKDTYANESQTGIFKAHWDSAENIDKSINMDLLMSYTGNTVATEVFTRYYDSTVDAQYAAANGRTLDNVTTNNVTAAAKNRYDDLYSAKSEFYDNAQGFVDNDKNYYISENYNVKYGEHYSNYGYKHFGVDFGLEGGSEGNNIYAGLSGKVSDKNWYYTNGNCLQIEYGFSFEKTFISTGIFGEYMHMKNSSIYNKKDFVSANSVIGLIGNTGSSDGAHLHYSILTNNNSYYSDSTLQILLGNKINWGEQVQQINGTKHTYNPNLYYLNKLNKNLEVK